MNGFPHVSRLDVTAACWKGWTYTVNSRLAATPLTDTLIIRTAAKSQAKIHYRRLTEIELPLLQTLTKEDSNSRSLQCPLYIGHWASHASGYGETRGPFLESPDN